MKQILRSIIDFDADEAGRLELADNFKELSDFPVEWTRTDDKALFEYVRTHFQHFLEAPSFRVVADYFERADDAEALSRLKEVAATRLYTRSGFRYLLECTLEEQNSGRMLAAGREFLDILQKGLDVREGRKVVRKKGVADAIDYMTAKLTGGYIQPQAAVKLSGDIREDGDAVWQAFQQAASNPALAYGKLTGLNHIDVVNRGLRNGELWVHGGFPGELKTTFAENWAYNLVTQYKTSVVYWAFEQKYEQLRRHIYVIHSSHPKFSVFGCGSLDDRKVRDGLLNNKEQELFRAVIEDFSTNPNYGRFHIETMARTSTVGDIRLRTELLHKEFEVGLAVLDHGQGIASDKQYRDYTTEINSVVESVKRDFAFHFDRGRGLPVLLLFQLNREGKKEADKNNGVYAMSAFTYANQIEKAADVMTTSYLNTELRALGQAIIANQKNRDNPPFDPFRVYVDFPSKRIRNLQPFDVSAADMAVIQEALAAV